MLSIWFSTIVRPYQQKIRFLNCIIPAYPKMQLHFREMTLLESTFDLYLLWGQMSNTILSMWRRSEKGLSQLWFGRRFAHAIIIW
jgi:hypothetical protein